MAARHARGYEFYLRVLKVLLTSETYFQHKKIKFVSSSSHVCSIYLIDTDEIPT